MLHPLRVLSRAPLAALLLCNACLAPAEIGVRPAAAEQVRAELDACALTADVLSAGTHEVLALLDLAELNARDPEAALAALHAAACAEPERATLFALAEASYRLANRSGQRSLYLGAAVYAYLYLFERTAGDPPDPYDRRFRWACDIYNQGLLRACTERDGAEFELVEGRRELSVGALEVALDRSALDRSVPGTPGAPARAGNARFERFLAADRFQVHGLAVRLRDAGLGVPLIGVDAEVAAVPRPEPAAGLATRLAIVPGEMPVTAFLRLEGGLAELEGGLRATLELHSSYGARETEVAGNSVPLETDFSATLAHALDRPAIWEFSISGLFSGDSAARSNRLILARPFEPGLVPVVLVHGTASSPAYWADLFNSLMRDPELRERVQFWFFQYASGNPILYSAADLRSALDEALATFDPEGTDEALQRMVVVGHSQGGLLAHLVAVDGSLGWLEEISGIPIEDFGFDAKETELIARCLDFRARPYVERVVFLCTPHRGSFLSARWFARALGGLISLPSGVASLSRRVFADEKRLPPELRGRTFTSLSNMDPKSPLLERLVREPLSPDVKWNSIVAIGSADPDDPESLAGADDGVVEYASAHLEGVESEALIPASHSCQSHPATIRELRRILREHVRATP